MVQSVDTEKLKSGKGGSPPKGSFKDKTVRQIVDIPDSNEFVMIKKTAWVPEDAQKYKENVFVHVIRGYYGAPETKDGKEVRPEIIKKDVTVPVAVAGRVAALLKEHAEFQEQ